MTGQNTDVDELHYLVKFSTCPRTRKLPVVPELETKLLSIIAQHCPAGLAVSPVSIHVQTKAGTKLPELMLLLSGQEQTIGQTATLTSAQLFPVTTRSS